MFDNWDDYTRGFIHGILIMAAIAIVAVALSLTFSENANAYTASKLNQWEQVAIQHWSGDDRTSCVGNITREVVDSLPDLTDDDLSPLGAAYNGCHYKIVRNMTDYKACLVVVHEIGHLTGHDHVDLHDIMHPALPDIGYQFDACKKVAPPILTNAEADGWINARWSMITLRCKATNPSRKVCWGTSGMGKRLRWVVWKDGNYNIKGGKLR
jgi:hypothetical protein